MTTAIVLLVVMALLGWLAAAGILGGWMVSRERTHAAAEADAVRASEMRRDADVKADAERFRAAGELVKITGLLQTQANAMREALGLLQGLAKKLATMDASTDGAFAAINRRLDEMPLRFANLVYGAGGGERPGGPVSRAPAGEAEDRFAEQVEEVRKQQVDDLAEALVRQADAKGIEGYTLEQAKKDADTMLSGNPVER